LFAKSKIQPTPPANLNSSAHGFRLLFPAGDACGRDAALQAKRPPALALAFHDKQRDRLLYLKLSQARLTHPSWEQPQPTIPFTQVCRCWRRHNTCELPGDSHPGMNDKVFAVTSPANQWPILKRKTAEKDFHPQK